MKTPGLTMISTLLDIDAALVGAGTETQGDIEGVVKLGHGTVK